MTQETLKLALEMVQNKMYAHAEMYLKEALAQPEQEPVAWSISPAVKGEDGRLYAYTNEKEWALSLVLKGHEIRPLVHGDTIPPQRTEQEPVADDFFKMIADRNPKPFLPPQRTWVGLTNDEVNNIAAGCHLGNSVQDAIFRAEAKLKQKNGYAEEKNT